MYRRFGKAILSFVLGIVALALLWWFLLIIAVAIKIDSPGPVLFCQKRVGIHRTHFWIYKFRTMRTDTPHDVPTHLLDADQYITHVGRFLRKYSLDELPQLFNIIGFGGIDSHFPVPQMGFVGPRPALWNQFDLLAERDRYSANDVRPGLTGWAQIHGRDTLEIPEKARLDGWYVKHLCLKTDLQCIFGTFRAAAEADGVVEGGTGAMKKAAIQKEERDLKECEGLAGQRGQKDPRDRQDQEEPKNQESRQYQEKLQKQVDRQNRKDQRVRSTRMHQRALIVTNHSYMLWRFRRELIARLMENCEVYVSMPFVGHEKDFAAMGVHCIKTDVDRRGMDPRKDGRLIRHYREILDEVHPDFVITYSIKPNIYAGNLCASRGIPYFVNVQGLGTAFEKPALAAVVTVLYRHALRKACAVFFENQDSAQEFLRRKILREEKTVVLRGAGINLEEVPDTPVLRRQPVNAESAAANAAAIPLENIRPPENGGSLAGSGNPQVESGKTCVHFLYVGRIMREKGMDELFSAIRILQKERRGPGNSLPPFLLDLVGFFEDECRDQVKQLETDGLVRFHGFQENPIPFYQAADCVVMPSYHEGLSNVLLEAAAIGRPVITTDIPGCREAVEDGVTGLLCQVKDTDSLAAAMKRFLLLSGSEKEKMGKLAREKMEREFNRADVVDQTIAVIQENLT